MPPPAAQAGAPEGAQAAPAPLTACGRARRALGRARKLGLASFWRAAPQAEALARGGGGAGGGGGGGGGGVGGGWTYCSQFAKLAFDYSFGESDYSDFGLSTWTPKVEWGV